MPAPHGPLPRIRTTQTSGQHPVFEIDGPAVSENHSFAYPYGLDDDRVRVQIEFLAIIDRGDGQKAAEPQPEPDAPAPLTINITVQGSVTSERDLVAAIRDALHRQGTCAPGFGPVNR